MPPAIENKVLLTLNACKEEVTNNYCPVQKTYMRFSIFRHFRPLKMVCIKLEKTRNKYLKFLQN